MRLTEEELDALVLESQRKSRESRRLRAQAQLDFQHDFIRSRDNNEIYGDQDYGRTTR